MTNEFLRAMRCQRHKVEGGELRSRPRRRRHRRHHLLHQHLQSERMMAAGLLARNAVAKGLTVKPWVKTSLAPGSQVVQDYLKEADLQRPLDKLGFNIVGFGCTTCIGNSGPLAPEISAADRQAQSGRGGGSLGQSQLRGPGQSGRARELPRFPAAGRRLRARRLDAGRPHPRSARRRQAGQAGLSRRHLAEDGGDRALRRDDHQRENVQDQICERVRRRRQLAQGEGAGGQTYAWDIGSTYVQEPPISRG